jgi:hypothetical protein
MNAKVCNTTLLPVAFLYACMRVCVCVKLREYEGVLLKGILDHHCLHEELPDLNFNTNIIKRNE